MHDRILRAIFETFAPPEADGARGAAGMRHAIQTLPPHRARELRRFIGLLSAAGFVRWPFSVRQLFLRALGDAPVAQLHTAFLALKRLALFVAYAATDERNRNPLWSRIGYPGPRSDVPALNISLPSTTGASGNMQADAVVIGSGAGGGVAAALLARSGIASPHLGRHLRLHPTLPIVAEFDSPIEPWHGPIQTALCAKFSDLDDGYGAVIEACPAHPGIFASALPWRSRREHADAMSSARNCATLIVLSRDRGEGSVSVDGRNDVEYALAPDDATRLREVAAHAVELARAAGAKTVTVPLGAKRVTLFSAHQMGTARMHADPSQGVVDAYGRVHGIEGLIVADASVFPLASGVNPMLTIMALAHRALKGTAALRT